ncbi:MAG: PD-(D/E)XK nuclease family protein [Clostridia bacterium]|nr:PD-(D/E)XK nuclease family protein [Clostridia bacterium]
MSKKILYYGDYAQAFEAVRGFISDGLDEKTVVICPDKFTLRLEKQLFSQKGSFTTEVTSFDRLHRRVCKGVAVSREGGIIIVKHILGALKLEYYNKSKNYPGFAVKMYEAIHSLMEAGVTPDVLTTPKLSDIALIYREYLREIADKYADLSKKFTDLMQNAEYFAGKRVVIVGFNGYSSCETALIDEIARHAELVQLDCQQKIVANSPVTVVGRAGSVNCLKETAKKIRNAFLGGALPEGIAVVSAPTSFERIKRIFSEYEIPFFIDAKKKLSEYPAGNFLCALFEVKNQNYSKFSLLTLAKNCYSGLKKTESDALEKYLNACGGDRKEFFEPFKLEINGFEIAERARKKLVDCMTVCEKHLGESSLVAGINAIIDGYKMRFNDSYEPESNIDKIVELCEVIDKIKITSNRLALLCEGIRSTDISVIPTKKSSVAVGEPSLFRGYRPKLLVLVGCNEGQIPSYLSDSGILSDDDVDFLNRNGKVFESRREINEKEEREVMELICLSGEVLAIYDETAETKKSDFLHIFERYGDAEERESDGALSQKSGDATANFEPYGRLLYDCCTQSAALEKLIVDYAPAVFGKQAVLTSREKPFFDALYYAVEDRAKQFFRPIAEFECKLTGRDMVKDSTYISQLQAFFECPAKHFFRYGLRVKAQETSELLAVDIGNLMHKVVELVVKDGYDDGVEKAVERAMETAVSEGVKYALKENEKLLEKVKEETVKVVEILISHLKKGKFGDALTETEFGEGCEMRGIALDTNPPVTLRGKIDMIDFCDKMARVVDYKTGNAEFSFTDIYYGKKLQLPLYLAVVRSNGYDGVGTFYFPLKYSWKDDAFSHRFSGIFRGDLSTALIMDETLQTCESEVIDAKFTKKGEFRCKSALSDQEFSAVLEYSKLLAKTGVEKIRSGYATPSPAYSAFSANPCMACDYYYACPSGSPRQKKTVTVDTLVSAVNKKEEEIL